jgi:HlyD family secretion protein
MKRHNTDRLPRIRGGLAAALLVAVAMAGCHNKAPEEKPIESAPAVHLVKPEKRDLHREVGQPGYVYAYEQTSLFPKVSGFIDEWLVDIGDPIEKGQLLAHIYVPELHARYREKKAQVELSEARVRVAERAIKVARQNVEVAIADVKEAQSKVASYAAQVKRWQSEVKRLEGITDVVDKQVLAESRLQLRTNTAAKNAAESAVTAAQARKVARDEDLEKAKADLQAARAQVKVDQANEEHLAALVGYTDMHAPYDGIVTVRNVNTGDYVEPRYGDESPPSAGWINDNPTRGTPLYVVARTDIVRIYVDVPEMEAHYVHKGTKARVRVEALNDADIPGTVTRTSWALNFRSRTLRAEIDLPNKDARLLPGMYAYGLVEIVRRGVRAVPLAAVIEIGNENSVYLHKDGKAYRTPVETGVNDGKYIEVIRKRIKRQWEPFTGEEEVIIGDLAELRNGEKVQIAKKKAAASKGGKEEQGKQEKR